MNECGHCGVRIGEEPALLARGKLWHVHHLYCDLCSCRIHEGERCNSHGGLLLCSHCNTRATRPQCQGCKEHIVGDLVDAIGGVWHPTCFQCAVCQHPLSKKFVLLPTKLPVHLRCHWELILKVSAVQQPKL